MQNYDLDSKNGHGKVFSVILLHLVVFVIIGLLILMKFPCPFKQIFGIPCPACGTLHALDALFRLDFNGYVGFNYLALPMVSVVWLGIHKRSLFKGGKAIDLLIYIVFALVIIRYILNCCVILK